MQYRTLSNTVQATIDFVQPDVWLGLLSCPAGLGPTQDSALGKAGTVALVQLDVCLWLLCWPAGLGATQDFGKGIALAIALAQLKVCLYLTGCTAEIAVLQALVRHRMLLKATQGLSVFYS